MPGRLDIPILGTNTRVPFWMWGPAALIGLTITGYFVFMNNFLRYFWPKNWGAVQEAAIYRSDRILPHLTEKMLTKHGIQVIVNMEGRIPGDECQDAEITACKRLGIELKRFAMRGNGIPGDPLPQAVEKYARALAAIAQARSEGKVVLIQCAAGRHRTGGMTATYRMLIEGDPAHEAYAELRAYGWKQWKHQVLADWINANMSEIARWLVELGTIDAVPDPLPYLGPEGADPVRRDPAEVHAEAFE